MKYSVRILRRAKQDHRIILSHIAERSKTGAVAWAKALDKALMRLANEADTFPLAPESDHAD